MSNLRLERLAVPAHGEWLRRWSSVDGRDPLHQPSDAAVQWTTVNLGEVFPGVPTPLNWSVLGSAGERGLRRALHAIGAYRRSETAVPDDPAQRAIGIAWGRAVANLDVFRNFADRTPGTSGDAMEAQIFGSVQSSGASSKVYGRYPAVLMKMPLAAMQRRSMMLRLRADTERWWQQAVFRPKAPDRLAATTLMWDAHRRITAIFDPHNVIMMLALGFYTPVRRLAERAGLAGLETKLLYTGDTEESHTVADLWSVSRNRLSLADFISRHGFHGPQENELSSRVWREHDAPLRALVQKYRGIDESASPHRNAEARLSERAEAERTLLSGLGTAERAKLRLLLTLARRYVPLREAGRDAFLKGMDVVRYAARLIGADLQRRGLLDEPDDAFYLTPVELTELPDGLRDLVAHRRQRRAYYESLALPERWRGAIEPRERRKATTESAVQGVGVSAGMAEGRVRVVLDPARDELEEGEILVCRTTDPGWASYFFIAGGAVIDIGGPLSHGAIVARELGLPCVINARNATEQLRTGDRVRIDGSSGRVEILERTDCEQAA